jgi:hypothetical protein
MDVPRRYGRRLQAKTALFAWEHDRRGRRPDRSFNE